jgi:hypothetical protein
MFNMKIYPQYLYVKTSRGACSSSPWEKIQQKSYMFMSHQNFRENGGPTWIRTRDQPVMSRELYQLSYGPPTAWQIIILYKVWITVNDRLKKYGIFGITFGS